MTTQPPSVPAVNIEQEAREWYAKQVPFYHGRDIHPADHGANEMVVADLVAFHQHMLSKSSPASLPMGVKPVVFLEMFAGQQHAGFRIGNQKFLLRPLRKGTTRDIIDSGWQAEMLTKAFTSLTKLLSGASFQRVGVEEIMEVVKEWENDVSLGRLPMRHDAWFNDLRSRLTAMSSKPIMMEDPKKD